MLRWGLPTAVLTIAAVVVAAVWTQRTDVMAPGEDGSIDGLTSILAREVTDDMVTISMEEEAGARGIDFSHFPGERASLLPEDMGSGVAWGDFDDDGDDDLFVVNYAAPYLVDLGSVGPEGASRLYRNDGGMFLDITADAGLSRPMRGNAAAWGDYDADGDLDLYLSGCGANRLYRNDAGMFTDVAPAAGVDDDGFGAGIAWFDADGDGWIDLYVCNYVDFTYRASDRARHERQYGAEVPYTLNPSSYAAQANRLYRNLGDGTFLDVALAAGVENPDGRSLGAAPFDFDMDGDIDLYVANDVSANGVFRNNGDGTFEDIGAQSLAADYRGAMGMAVGDADHDGDLDLFVTHWIAQENAFFENMHSEGWVDDEGHRRLFFMDSAELLGLGQVSLNTVGWSTGFVDFDNDGLDDLWVANGHTLEDELDSTKLRPQRLQLFRQIEGEGFFDVSAAACADMAEPLVGRGGASSDFDGDGRVDLIVSAHSGQPRLFRNTSGGGHSIIVRVRQPGPNTRALGAIIEVRAGGMPPQIRQVGASAAYLSQDSLDACFGVGTADRVDLTVRWPDGRVSSWTSIGAGSVVQVTPDGELEVLDPLDRSLGGETGENRLAAPI